ncbi:hypothetical protein V2G26_011632 [Clonostachys chloroleuca]|uniref:GID complex catalytic subunit 2 n=1 Tax=Clonostachys chloroleuca TaxID=1926264 RepID=A0AA35LVY4_9HYPO|nr:unnamed protein product [Clonostachys chloroleuca]
MTGADNAPVSPFAPLQADLARMKKSNLNAAIGDVDKILEMLERTREQVAQESESHKISMAMTRLQNPIKEKCDAITSDLKEVTKAQRAFGKALDKAMPLRDLPMETDAMAEYPEHVVRAIGMHLLREGQFSVASTFVDEAEHITRGESFMVNPLDATQDNGMDSRSKEDLQHQFAKMYEILAELKASNLIPAIEWARENSRRLEARGSTLEFELSKLQFIWLFKGASDTRESEFAGQTSAFDYGRQHFARFQRRHLREIAQLCTAMVYAPNLEESPYNYLFQTDTAFDEVALSFTREFCSLLGLSAESPLYVAVTAGSIALPRLLKYTTYMKEKKTEWSTVNELAFETPLPPSMIYHPIFVCPVSKEQTTELNPPMMLICGHVISRDSLHNIAKGSRYKCPYCPQEGATSDTVEIFL